MWGARGEAVGKVRNAPTGGVDDHDPRLPRAASIHLGGRIGVAENILQQLVESPGRGPNFPHQHGHARARDAPTASEMRTSVMGSDGSAATLSSDGAASACAS